MAKGIFRGTGVAMVTPFDQGGMIDVKGIHALTEHLVTGGVDYLVVMGTTGENPTLTETEQMVVLDEVLTQNNGRKPVVFGIGGNNTSAIAHRMDTFNRKGVDGFLSVSPYYNKPSQEGIFHHYQHLNGATDLPIIMYNVPGRTGSLVSAETTLRISELEHIVATKEASGSLDVCMEIIRNKAEDFMVISGDDAYTLPFISVGMEGLISVIGNAYPQQISNLVNQALSGEWESAKSTHYNLLPMIEAMFADGNPGGVKTVLNALGICGKTLRLPLYQVSEKVNAQLLSEMKNIK